jgi:hypothetical protein
MSDTAEHHHRRSWADVDEDSQRFRALLGKYHDYQKATDAAPRGEEAEPAGAGGRENPP